MTADEFTAIATRLRATMTESQMCDVTELIGAIMSLRDQVQQTLGERDAALGVVAETKHLAQQENIRASNERDVLRSRVRALEAQLANVARLTAQHAQMRESLEWIVARCGPRIRDFRSAALRMSERASATLWKLA